jgi:hypothetical protein
VDTEDVLFLGAGALVAWLGYRAFFGGPSSNCDPNALIINACGGAVGGIESTLGDAAAAGAGVLLSMLIL